MRLALLVCSALLVAAAIAVPAMAGGGGTDVGDPSDSVSGPQPDPPRGRDRENPCAAADADETLRCPNLVMGRPADLYVERTRKKRILLHAANQIINIGDGPMELRGQRLSPARSFRMSVTQAIERRSGGVLLRPTRGRLFFKPIPGQYRYWKFVDTAALEIWAVDAQGNPTRRVRSSPKKVYCLRDLLRLDQPPAGSPGRMHYPACNQDPAKRRVTLGTSVGWVDRYPALYHEQYVDVTGLRGRFAYVMIADPSSHLAESNETDNASWVTVTLPPKKRKGYLPGY